MRPTISNCQPPHFQQMEWRQIKNEITLLTHKKAIFRYPVSRKKVPKTRAALKMIVEYFGSVE